MWYRTDRLGTKDITLLCRQLAILLKAGLPLMKALDGLIQSTTHLRLRTVMQQLQTQLTAGLSLAEAMQQQPHCFNYLLCQLIAIGEKSASLEIMLNTIADYREKLALVKNKMRKMLTYPLAILIISLLVSALLLLLVVPQFELLFQSFEAELPWLTRIIIKLSSGLQRNWLLLLTIFGTLIYTLHYAYQQIPSFRQWRDKLLLQLPYLGRLFNQTLVARFARTLAMTYAAGLSLLEALQAAAEVTNNSCYHQSIKRVQTAIVNGQSLQTAFTQTGLFPAMVTELLSVAEASATLAPILLKIADYYDDEVSLVLNHLNNFFEPIIICILGMVIGCLVLAMYLPIIRFGTII